MKLSNPYPEVESTSASIHGSIEVVFRTSFVEVGEIHAHPLFPVGFLHQYYIGQPHGVVNFLDELSF